MFRDWDWDDTWRALIATVIVAAVITLGMFIFSPKNVDYYYLSQSSSGDTNKTTTCVYAHWTWHADEIAFCTKDATEALNFAFQANVTAVKK